MDIVTVIDQQLRAAGIPILGVSIKNPADRSTWTVQFAPEASTPQKTHAATLLATAVVDAAALADADLVARLNTDKLYKATVIWIAGLVGKTPTQARNEITAIYKALP